MHASTTTTRTILVEGRTRTVTVIVPSTVASSPAATLVFHGSNQTAESFRTFSAHTFEAVAERDGGILAYLDGYRKHWNDARASIGFAARKENIDDVGFAAAVIELLGSEYGADPGRMFATGFSNGGQLVIRLAHELPDTLAGIAIMSATQPEAENFQPSRNLPGALPTILFHGTKDPLVPYEGGMASMWGLAPRGRGLSAPDTAAYFAGRNQITAAPSNSTLHLPGTTATAIRRTDYRQPGRAPVSLVTVEGGGHIVPNPRRAPRIMGPSTDRVVAADEIARFFATASTGAVAAQSGPAPEM